MRAMGAFFGAGLMDRYANLRFAVLESGFGWIPFWAERLDEQRCCARKREDADQAGPLVERGHIGPILRRELQPAIEVQDELDQSPLRGYPRDGVRPIKLPRQAPSTAADP